MESQRKREKKIRWERKCIYHISSYCRLDGLNSALRACTRDTWFKQPDNFAESPCFGLLCFPPSREESSSQGHSFQNKPTNSASTPLTTSHIRLSHSWPWSSSPSHFRATCETAGDSPSAPNAGMIQLSQSQACLPCLTYFFSRKAW